MADPLIYKLRDVVSTVQIGGELHDFEITIDNTTDARVIETQIMKAAFTKFGDGPDIRLVGYTVSSTFEAYGADPSLSTDRQIAEVMRGERYGNLRRKEAELKVRRRRNERAKNKRVATALVKEI